MRHLPLWLALVASPMPVSAAAAAADTMCAAEVRKVDLSSARITLRHGDIVPLYWQALTVVAQVRDKQLLDGVKVSDKLRFNGTPDGSQFFFNDVRPA